LNKIFEFFWPGIPADESAQGQEIRLRQFLLVAKATLTISGGNLINSILTAFLFWNILPHAMLIPWLIISVAASGNRIWAALRPRQNAAPTRVSRRTIIRSTFWSAAAGAMWGAIAISMAVQGSILHHVFLAFVVGGQAISAAVWLSPILSSSYAYIWLSVAPLVASLAWHGEQMTTVMAGMLAIFLIASFQLSRRTHADFAKAVADKLKLENLYDQLSDSEERLITAIETVDAGFALYDDEDRLVLANSRYREFYHLASVAMYKGATFERILRTAAAAGQHPEALGRIEDWVAERMSRHLNPDEPFEQKLANNQWYQVSEYRTKDGGLVAVSTDITKLKDAYESLKLALDQAETANQAKSEFLSSMSHELRTPLNAILGFAQLMQTDPTAEYSQEQEESIRQILSGGKHLLELISQVLDLARIETGNIVVSIEDVLLQDVFDQCLPLAENLARKHNILLGFTPFGKDLVVRGDATRIKQVLLNLLSNAIKYNYPGGEVSVDCTPTDDGKLIVAVSDNGPGIPEEKHDQVFEPFNRLGAEAGEKEGTGIGLTITKQLLEMMEGRIGFDSKPGEGTTFWFEIPLTETTLADRNPNDNSSDNPKTTLEATGESPLRGRVLYVEDNPANVRRLESIVSKRSGIELIVAGSAEEGLELVLKSRPDLMFLDIGLPGMDGYEAAEILKSDPATNRIPIIAVSAYSNPAEIERGKAAGFDAFIPKPLQEDVILAELDRRLGLQQETTPV
jgi:signal transduction histidine kinase/ActR/RegA family two-component response regulator